MPIEKHIKLNGFEQSVDIEIAHQPKALLFKFEIKDNAYLFIHVYNPEGEFIGEVLTGTHHLFHQLYYENSEASYNGKAHSLLHGKYKIKVLSFSQKEELALEVKVYEGDEAVFLSKTFDEAWFSRKQRYYKGDLHGHTLYSDGHLSPNCAMKVIADQKLDFMAMTEHNMIPLTGRYQTSQLIIPAFELTLATAHLNIYGVDWNQKEPLLDLSLLKESEGVTQLLDSWKAVNHVSLNHPFMIPWHCHDAFIELSQINTIEVICDPTYPSAPEANKKAVAFLDFLWNEGYHIYGIGGSDAHEKPSKPYKQALLPSIYGDPSTYIYAEELSVEALLLGLKKGQCYVSRFLSLKISIGEKQVLPGSAMTLVQEGDVYTVACQIEEQNLDAINTFKGLVGVFVVNGQVYFREALSENMKCEFKHFGQVMQKLYNQEGYAWCRFGICDEQDIPIAYVNPIFWGERRTDSKKINQLIREFEVVYD